MKFQLKKKKKTVIISLWLCRWLCKGFTLPNPSVADLRPRTLFRSRLKATKACIDLVFVPDLHESYGMDLDLSHYFADGFGYHFHRASSRVRLDLLPEKI